jgi:hypothetical protein
MSVTSTAADPRTVDALGLAVRSGSWAKARTMDGQKFYGIESRTRPGLLHLADTQACTCEDHKYRGAVCAHIVAVRLHVEQVRCKQALEAKRRTRHAPDQIAAGSRLYAELFSEEG